MPDQELIRENLSQIMEAAERIKRRFAPIRSPGDFIVNEEGRDRLDGICMMLIAIGESLKNLDKVTKGELLRRYPQVDWKGAKSVRDVISHHYFQVDVEIVYEICLDKMPGLLQTIKAMLEELPQHGSGCI